MNDPMRPVIVDRISPPASAAAPASAAPPAPAPPATASTTGFAAPATDPTSDPMLDAMAVTFLSLAPETMPPISRDSLSSTGQAQQTDRRHSLPMIPGMAVRNPLRRSPPARFCLCIATDIRKGMVANSNSLTRRHLLPQGSCNIPRGFA